MERPPFAADFSVRITRTGESGMGPEVYKKYGFDAERIAGDILKRAKQ
jgi:transketolase